MRFDRLQGGSVAEELARIRQVIPIEIASQASWSLQNLGRAHETYDASTLRPSTPEQGLRNLRKARFAAD